MEELKKMEEFRGPFIEPSLKNLQTMGKIPKQQNPKLQNFGKPHIDSFDYIADEGLEGIVASLRPVEFKFQSGEKVTVKILHLSIGCPEVEASVTDVAERRIFPTECRQGASTYKGRLTGQISVTIDGVTREVEKDFGGVPVMVKSKMCNLRSMKPRRLIRHNEESEEWGGYFIINGKHRLIRMLQLNRRNYPIAVTRRSWMSRGDHFTEYGILIRCVDKQQTSKDNVLHHVKDGTATLSIIINRHTFLIPIMFLITAMGDLTDSYVYQKIMKGYEDDFFFGEAIRQMFEIRCARNVWSKNHCREYLGAVLRDHCTSANLCPEWYTNKEIGMFVIKNYVLIHVDDCLEKADVLIFMIQKLHALVIGKCLVEGTDNVMMHEVLLGGHLYLQLLKEKLEMWTKNFQLLLRKLQGVGKFNPEDLARYAKSTGGVDMMMERCISTGNLNSNTGLGLMQQMGMTIVAENINITRYMSHFRSIHRGSYFVEMRTTEARQLLPDAWGFICPVHTPDGTPCGLLNHLADDCVITQVPDHDQLARLPRILASLGVVTVREVMRDRTANVKECYSVLLDGRVMGYVDHDIVEDVVHYLKRLKIEGEQIPNTTEIVFIRKNQVVGQFPGLFLFTGPARMMRPVYSFYGKKIEYIGTFEQVYLEIAITAKGIYPESTRYLELSKTAMLSNLAKLIPWPDCNQSPRNMYQCQMSKQTMGTPIHTWHCTGDGKLYRLQTPQSPLVRPAQYDKIQLDDYPMGTNAIIAVISYTGYDMEDALIINKASYERGFGHGSIYKSTYVELGRSEFFFQRDPTKPNLENFLDEDGLPYVGSWLKYDQPYYSYYDVVRKDYVTVLYKGRENCVVHKVRLCGSFETKKTKKKVCIVYRIPRNPEVGDKFASRAGQKGILSKLYPAEDMPFTDQGMVPDVIFNPHSFPSRMTVAMLIELMAGKSAAVHGHVYDATPFRFTEENTSINFFGELLEKGGYNYYGTEVMTSGITGTELEVEIFYGIVYYQRLRHMVADKWQVRTTGLSDIHTRQPVGGRQRGGAVRFGEMERDALISHGSSFLLQDRLLNNSDKTRVLFCRNCRTMVGPISIVTRPADKPYLVEKDDICRLCKDDKDVALVEIPYVLRTLIIELASMNINLRMNYDDI